MTTVTVTVTDDACTPAQPTPAELLAAINELRSTMTQATDDLLREVQETQTQNAAVVAAITQLTGVVQPLLDAVATAQAALAAAQAELASLQSANAALDTQLAGAAANLDAAQGPVQDALDSIPTP